MFGRGVGFLKFKADVIDNQTEQKVKQTLMFFHFYYFIICL